MRSHFTFFNGNLIVFLDPLLTACRDISIYLTEKMNGDSVVFSLQGGVLTLAIYGIDDNYSI